MFRELGHYLLAPTNQDGDALRRLDWAQQVGVKACGLRLFPRAWTPPFFVVSADLFRKWAEYGEAERGPLIAGVSASIAQYCGREWSREWAAGLLLRSSSVTETLTERGAYESLEVPADFGPDLIKSSIERLYSTFPQASGSGPLALVVQARASLLFLGHLSNERRVSKTVNQWTWEAELPAQGCGRFNSQRASPPDPRRPLVVPSPKERSLLPFLRSIGRWCTNLGVGSTHLEWGLQADRLWLFQIDFEKDQPDEGCNPREFLRAVDNSPTGTPPPGSPLQQQHTLVEQTGWSKLDKVRLLAEGRHAPYPRLFAISGAALRKAMEKGYDLAGDIQTITNGRAVCRTDCTNPAIPKLNLPRTESVGPGRALEFMTQTLAFLEAGGASESEICFILHKFIPATAAAWALAYPERQIVLIDGLWGLPDGLQYLNHDTFEFDLKRGEVSSERLRYKPKFLQETATGEWRLVSVARSLARGRSLSSGELREVAQHSHAVAARLGKPVRIMWFCGVDDEAGVGRNVPWFMMPPEEATPKPRQHHSIAPNMRRVSVRNMGDLSAAEAHPTGGCVLVLEPEADLFRNDEFLKAAAETAKRKSFPVQLTGSILSHAYYTLERSGATVLTVDAQRTRVRQRQVFRKLVRDEIPTRIAEQGEKVIRASIRKSDSRAALLVKLFEEAHELLAANTLPEVTGELADILEVVRALATATGADWAHVQEAADEKRRSRGSFEKGVVLLETSWPSWREEVDLGGDREIALKELGRIAHEGLKHTVTFPAAISKRGANVVELRNGSTIALSLSGAGIVVEEVSPGSSSTEQQLNLDFLENAADRLRRPEE